MCNAQWDTNTHIMHYSLCLWIARGVRLPSVGAVVSAPSSVAVASAEVRGLHVKVSKQKQYQSHSTTSTTDVLYQPRSGEHDV